MQFENVIYCRLNCIMTVNLICHHINSRILGSILNPLTGTSRKKTKKTNTINDEEVEEEEQVAELLKQEEDQEEDEDLEELELLYPEDEVEVEMEK